MKPKPASPPAHGAGTTDKSVDIQSESAAGEEDPGAAFDAQPGKQPVSSRASGAAGANNKMKGPAKAALSEPRKKVSGHIPTGEH